MQIFEYIKCDTKFQISILLIWNLEYEIFQNMLFRLMNDKQILINQFKNKMISWRSIFIKDFKIQLIVM